MNIMVPYLIQSHLLAFQSSCLSFLVGFALCFLISLLCLLFLLRIGTLSHSVVSFCAMLYSLARSLGCMSVDYYIQRQQIICVHALITVKNLLFFFFLVWLSKQSYIPGHE
jgi:hypothetical protein